MTCQRVVFLKGVNKMFQISEKNKFSCNIVK